ncbi:MAG: hypothetical protein ACRYG2_37140, partial [Janthinobacterium lividum]
FADVPQPVYIRENVYLTGAEPYEAEKGALVLEGDASARVVDDGTGVYLETELPDSFGSATTGVVIGTDLPPVRFVDADFDEIDGRPAVLDTDVLGEVKDGDQTYPAGAVATLRAGSQRTRLW